MSGRAVWWLVSSGVVLLAALGTGVVLLVGLIVAPVAAVENIAREDVVGVWVGGSGGHQLSLEFLPDGTIHVDGWPSQVACRGRESGLTVESLDWSDLSNFSGRWDGQLGGPQIFIRLDRADSDCESSPTFVMDKNYRNGELHLKVYVDGFDNESEYLRFVKQAADTREPFGVPGE